MTSDALTSGITTDDLDPAVRPQDDLFRHVNGRWIARTEIPDDKARYGSFLVLAEEAEAAVRDIIHESQEAEPGTEARKVGDLFTSFLDEGRVEALGAAPLRPLLEQVEQVGDVPDLLRLVGSFEKQGVASFVQLFVDNDPGDPERYVVFLEQGGLGLPDESYYREEKFESVRTAYVAFVETMLGLAGLDDAAGRAARVVALETELATHHWSNVATRDSDATYNLQPWSELAASAAGVDLAVWRDAVQAPAGTFDEVVVREPSFVSGLAGLLVDEVG
jgi:putative endopeptidase